MVINRAQTLLKYALWLFILHLYMSINKDFFKICLGNNIRRQRFELGLTVEQLALNSGLTYSQVSRIELGKISTSAFTIYIISNTLNTSPAILFEMPKKVSELKQK
jgi:hypothetical protein